MVLLLNITSESGSSQDSGDNDDMATTRSSALLITEHHALVIQRAEDEDSDDLFNRVCEQDANRKIEQDTKGNVRVMVRVGFESSDRESEVIAQLKRWVTQNGRGAVSASAFATCCRMDLNSVPMLRG
jgi:hypothetical protein